MGFGGLNLTLQWSQVGAEESWVSAWGLGVEEYREANVLKRYLFGEIHRTW